MPLRAGPLLSFSPWQTQLTQCNARNQPLSPVLDGTLVLIQASFGIQVCWECWDTLMSYMTSVGQVVFLLLQYQTFTIRYADARIQVNGSILSFLKSAGGERGLTVDVKWKSACWAQRSCCWQKEGRPKWTTGVHTTKRRSHAWKASLQETQIMSFSLSWHTDLKWKNAHADFHMFWFKTMHERCCFL